MPTIVNKSRQKSYFLLIFIYTDRRTLALKTRFPMSQHIFTATIKERYPLAGQTANVLCGWDRPLQYYFLLVEVGEGEAERTIYDSLTEPDLGLYSTAEVELRAAAVGIELPGGLLPMLLEECQQNAGNKRVRWTEQGADVLSVG